MKAPKKLDLPEAILWAGFGVLGDFLSIIPFFGTLFMITFYAIFKFKGLSAPFPIGSMFIKVIPLVSITPTCTAYVWRVYRQNQPSGILSAVTEVTDPKAALAATALPHLLPDEAAGGAKQKKAA